MAKRRRISIPNEIHFRFDDVAYELASDNFIALPDDQKARVIDEAKHLIDLIQRGGNWYGTDEEGQAAAKKDLREAKAFLKKVNECGTGNS